MKAPGSTLYLFPRFWPAAVVWSAVSQQEIPSGSPAADPRSVLHLEPVAGLEMVTGHKT